MQRYTTLGYFLRKLHPLIQQFLTVFKNYFKKNFFRKRDSMVYHNPHLLHSHHTPKNYLKFFSPARIEMSSIFSLGGRTQVNLLL
jgi:hypothetical protein